MENKNQFKPFDKVLVRDHYNKRWKCDFYSHKTGETGVQTIHDVYSIKNVIPYEGNEDLVGTTDEPEEEIKLEEGEWMMVGDGEGCFNNALQWHLSQFHRIRTVNNEERLHVSVGLTTADCLYGVKFSDFNPNNTEEIRKHILHVKNGKIIKYKN